MENWLSTTQTGWKANQPVTTTLSFASIYGPTMHTVGMTCDAKETPVHCVNIIQWRNPIGQFRSMLYSGPAMFNKLPDDMTNLNSLGFFKNSLKTLINN